jgi:lauroyl/myristoyl acyltransferase
MELTRSLRKSLTFAALLAGMRFAQRSKRGVLVESIREALQAATRAAIPLRRRLARNMELVGVHRPGLLDAYFERCIDQLCMIGHTMRAGFSRSGCLDRFTFDETFRFVEEANAAGKGVIHIAPHICGYPLYAAVVSSRIPCSVYLRRNTDPRKMRINEEVGLAGEGELIIPPAGTSKAERLNVALSVLRQGKMLFLTPDTPRKSYQGVAVTIFGRRTYFPSGPFIMSARTGAPVVPSFWHWEDGRYHMRWGGPIEIRRGRHVGRQAEAAVQAWARSVDAHLREHPALWWNWLDKRWTSIIRNGAGASSNGRIAVPTPVRKTPAA